MADTARGDDFDEFDKPGAERSRRRRGGDDDLESDFEEDLLDEDWLSFKKNNSELSDEELNDDLLQSDEEDQNTSNQAVAVSLNATESFTESYEFEEGEGYTAEEYEAAVDEYGDNGGMEYTSAQNEDAVLDLDINEPLEDEFQADEYGAELQDAQADHHHGAEEDEPDDQDASQVTETEEIEPEPDVKEESDEDEDDDKESRRLRFKTERKDTTVIRLSDAATKRRNIPETLELTEEAKADLQEFEEKERQRKQGRFEGRGRGRGGRGGPYGFGMGGFRKDGGAGRGRTVEPRPPLMQMNLQPRKIPSQPHHPLSRPPGQRGGLSLFPSNMGPIPQQPLQSLIPPCSQGPNPRVHQDLHPPLAHRHAHPLSHPQSKQQPKNIHINPHFKRPSSSSPVQVPLISCAQNQNRPSLNPQRFPAPVEFQQHPFLQPPRPPPQEHWRGPPPPPAHQDREPFYSNEPRFPGQPLFDLANPGPLLNNSILPLSFPQPMPGPGSGLGPGFCPPGGGIFQLDLPPRPGLPPQPTTPQPAPRNFMSHRQPFSPQHNAPFSPQHSPFGLQGLMQNHPQSQHHDHPPPHHPLHQQQIRHEVPLSPHNQHQLQHQHQPLNQRPILHLSHSPFRQPNQGVARPMKPHPLNNPGRMRMGSPSSMQQMQSPPQRNSNLRELPIATGHIPIRPIQPRNITRVNQNAIQPGPGTGGGTLGRGRGIAKAAPLPAALEMKKVVPGPRMSASAQRNAQALNNAQAQRNPQAQQNTQAQQNAQAQQNTHVQDEEEDEETRLYRLKIEEQKRLREEILKRKEMRRQMQAGARKKELLERLGAQIQPQSAPAQPQPQPQPQTIPSPTPIAPNGVKSHLQNVKVQSQTPVQQIQRVQHPQRLVPQVPKVAPQPQVQNPNLIVATPSEEKKSGLIQTQTNAPRMGGKRTVMQRVNTGGVMSPPIPQKVRVVKRLAGGDTTPNPDPSPQQQPQQPPPPPPQQSIGRLAPQQRLGAVRNVTPNPQQQLQQPEGSQANRVVVRGRGRGRGSRAAAQNRSNFRVPESQLSTVSIDGLSSSTTEKQIQNLLKSIGPIKMFEMLPQQRKAIAKFVNPQHALSFQHSFHRHMIDLSHIDVTLIDG